MLSYFLLLLSLAFDQKECVLVCGHVVPLNQLHQLENGKGVRTFVRNDSIFFKCYYDGVLESEGVGTINYTKTDTSFEYMKINTTTFEEEFFPDTTYTHPLNIISEVEPTMPNDSTYKYYIYNRRRVIDSVRIKN